MLSSSTTSRREGNERWVPAARTDERAGDAAESSCVDGTEAGGQPDREGADEGVAGAGGVDDIGGRRGADQRRGRGIADDRTGGTEGDDEAVVPCGCLGGDLVVDGRPTEQQLVLALVGDQPVGDGE